MSSFIEVKNLKKEFGHIKALNGVDLEIQEGEVFGILGPNGAGKTTLVRILSTLLKPSSGKVSVAGVTLPSEDYKLKKLLGYMPQIPSLYEDLPARKNLEFFSSLHFYNGHRENIQDKIEEILEFVELKDRQNDLISTFSSGMKQRLSSRDCLWPVPLSISQKSCFWMNLPLESNPGLSVYFGIILEDSNRRELP